MEDDVLEMVSAESRPSQCGGGKARADYVCITLQVLLSNSGDMARTIDSLLEMA